MLNKRCETCGTEFNAALNRCPSCNETGVRNRGQSGLFEWALAATRNRTLTPVSPDVPGADGHINREF
jgi:hypothetical protein